VFHCVNTTKNKPTWFSVSTSIFVNIIIIIIIIISRYYGTWVNTIHDRLLCLIMMFITDKINLYDQQELHSGHDQNSMQGNLHTSLEDVTLLTCTPPPPTRNYHEFPPPQKKKSSLKE